MHHIAACPETSRERGDRSTTRCSRSRCRSGREAWPTRSDREEVDAQLLLGLDAELAERAGGRARRLQEELADVLVVVGLLRQRDLDGRADLREAELVLAIVDLVRHRRRRGRPVDRRAEL